MESGDDDKHTDRPVDQRCILVVDDEPLNLKLFTLTLIRRGYRVLQATHGYQGFVLAHDCRPDLIVMDVQLPEISGLEVTRTLKDSIHTQSDGYITKPYAMNDLIELIGSLIERSNAEMVATG